MSAVLPLLLGGVALVLVIVGARALDARNWRNSLVAYRLNFPSALTLEDVVRWVSAVAAATNSPNWSLLPLGPVCLEVVSTPAGLEFWLLLSRRNEAPLLAGLRAAIPGVRIEETDEPPAWPRADVAAEATLSSLTRPLSTDKHGSTAAALLSSMQPLAHEGGEYVRWQYIFTSAGTPKPVHTAAPGEDRWWSAYLLEGELPSDAEAIRALRLKRQQQGPLLHVAVRLGTHAVNRERALRLLGRTWPQLHSANSTGVRVVRRFLPELLVAQRLEQRALPLVRWPILANATELAALLPLPTNGLVVPGLNQHRSRQLPSSSVIPSRGPGIVGLANWPGAHKRPLALDQRSRLAHLWITAPTGAGKSTLMAHLALQDIAAGSGVVVIDPKNDLVDTILERIPEERAEDVILLDPTLGRDEPVAGFNVLRAVGSEHDRERIADNVVHLMSEVWRGSWGPRTAGVLHSAILTLTHAKAPDGSAFTLPEVVELLTNPSFRRFVTEQPSVPTSVRGFWSRFESMSATEREQVISPSLNKLTALTTRSSLRLTLGQADGVDLGLVFRERKILLVKLNKGVIGETAAQLLGTLLVSTLWQTVLTRMAIPPAHRRPVYAYLDEFADLVRLPIPLAEMLSQARGLGLSMTLASQYAAQLPESVRTAVLGTVRSQLAMQQDYDDARLLAKRFAPLTADDLMGLEAYEFSLRPMAGGRTVAPVTGMTLPLGESLRDGQELARQSRERWGRPQAEIEAGLRARVGSAPSTSGTQGRFGRLPREGGRP